MAFGTAAQLYLQYFLEARDKDRRQLMLKHLRRITGQDFGNNKARWRKYIRENPFKVDSRSPEEKERELHAKVRQHYIDLGQPVPESLLNPEE